MKRPVHLVLLLVLLAPLAASCAYYNTFYLARKNYFKATDGAPYLIDKPAQPQPQYLIKTVDYSKKLLANYPKSKLVDDAYVLWARALLGQSDPLQTVNMLQDFSTRFPNSPLKAEATFFLGVGYRQSRRYPQALDAFDQFLAQQPKGELAPYAHLERSRCLMSLDRPAEAAQAAGQVLERFPKSRLIAAARRARAEALFKQGDFAAARQDFAFLGDRAVSDDERLDWLLRQADCLEGARDYDGSLALLKDAIAHERAPIIPANAGGANPNPTGGGAIGVSGAIMNSGPGTDRYGRLRLRIGTANLLAGRLEPALEAYRDVLTAYPRNALGAEAQYRLGYAYETVADDFEKARGEYAKVKEQGTAGGYADQAQQRLGQLDRLAQFRTAGGDSLEKKAESGFVRAELYLFQLDKPERALQEYERVAADLKGTPYEAKAMTAQAWVLSRKLKRQAEADSLLWAVVREHPATEAQLAARDYLEAEGASVPENLIQMPERLLARADTTAAPSAPLATTPLPDTSRAGRDALMRQALFGGGAADLRTPPRRVPGADSARFATQPPPPPSPAPAVTPTSPAAPQAPGSGTVAGTPSGKGPAVTSAQPGGTTGATPPTGSGTPADSTTVPRIVKPGAQPAPVDTAGVKP